MTGGNPYRKMMEDYRATETALKRHITKLNAERDSTTTNTSRYAELSKRIVDLERALDDVQEQIFRAKPYWEVEE